VIERDDHQIDEEMILIDEVSDTYGRSQILSQVLLRLHATGRRQYT
jgi:hypothetical protein